MSPPSATTSPSPAAAAAWLGSALLLGCAGAEGEGRRAWLHQQIVAENTFWLARSPEWLAVKYATMAASPYDYMRGTAGTYYSAQARRSVPRPETAFLRSAEAHQIWLLGDAHPENVGVMLHGDAVPPLEAPLPEDRILALEFYDLDAATFGPWLLDLRRSALGMQALTLNLEGCGEDCRNALTTAQAEGYLDGALGHASPDEEGALLADLSEEAREEGAERKRLLERTEAVEGGERRLLLDEATGGGDPRTPATPEEAQAGIFALTAAEAAQVTRLMAAYAAPPGFRVLDAGRRLGAGVSSLPAVRYVVLCDRGEEGVQDDDLLNVRELVDPPVVPGLLAEPGDRFADNAARIRASQQWLWTAPDADGAADAMLDPTAEDALSLGALHGFKVLTWSSWFQDIERTKVEEQWAEGDIDEDDLIALARWLGHALGAAHRRAPTAQGRPAAPVLEGELRGREDTLIAALTASAEDDLAEMLRDHDLFQQILAETSPLLGAEDIAQDILP